MALLSIFGEKLGKGQQLKGIPSQETLQQSCPIVILLVLKSELLDISMLCQHCKGTNPPGCISSNGDVIGCGLRVEGPQGAPWELSWVEFLDSATRQWRILKAQGCFAVILGEATQSNVFGLAVMLAGNFDQSDGKQTASITRDEPITAAELYGTPKEAWGDE
ncbi:hypothetical protein TWF569_001756 [Orbilia oligospora]|uniref:Uncharacterized protein n=1 Tax=Orbilia oligospora TaxID=2813651 RepID=A0A7C8NLM4_ORBOL|nr:hypothetical protein TWF103_003114 [Orbilia oligospora]KAF3098456.1 hypothetical protein TWF102_006021 [Orbilia oligospora]KAF3115113.1 hypothetical protein TWF706_007231 [Orbilia oligospora]KAF3120688.1 hypothetical protein TWF594_003693 [Orbilia oligospora]KAF3123277.1 hypothetical protein TWF569_001756 [Orbilia oligospora]